MEHEKTAQTVFDLLGKIGGILNVFLTMMTFFFGRLIRHFQTLNYLTKHEFDTYGPKGRRLRKVKKLDEIPLKKTIRLFFLRHWLYKKLCCCLGLSSYWKELKVIKLFRKRMRKEFDIKKQFRNIKDLSRESRLMRKASRKMAKARKKLLERQKALLLQKQQQQQK